MDIHAEMAFPFGENAYILFCNDLFKIRARFTLANSENFACISVLNEPTLMVRSVYLLGCPVFYPSEHGMPRPSTFKNAYR